MKLETMKAEPPGPGSKTEKRSCRTKYLVRQLLCVTKRILAAAVISAAAEAEAAATAAKQNDDPQAGVISESTT